MPGNRDGLIWSWADSSRNCNVFFYALHMRHGKEDSQHWTKYASGIGRSHCISWPILSLPCPKLTTWCHARQNLLEYIESQWIILLDAVLLNKPPRHKKKTLFPVRLFHSVLLFWITFHVRNKMILLCSFSLHDSVTLFCIAHVSCYWEAIARSSLKWLTSLLSHINLKMKWIILTADLLLSVPIILSVCFLWAEWSIVIYVISSDW